jgi:type VI secretion system protein ImpK
MRDEIADVVYPVFTLGIRFKEQLAAGEELDFADSQKKLQGKLQSTGRWADFGGDQPVSDSLRAPHGDKFLGMRYALACWLDEIFILDSSWKDQWRDQCLEWTLYGHVDRAWKFWEQADRAGARPSTDALEVFYLCVMLGFRGDKANKPEELKKWCERVKTQLDQALGLDFNLPPDGQPRTHVPPLTGARRLHKMLVAASVVLLVLVLPLMFLLVLRFK